MTPTQTGPGAAGRFPADRGEMGALIRGFDWSQTPLGPIPEWPQSLRSAVGLVLDSPVPTALYWGPALVALHNDAFRPLLGERDGLGRSFDELWSERLDALGPIRDRVLSGSPSRFSDSLMMLDRNGAAEPAWLDVTFSPVRDEAGAVVGMLNTAVETTDKVLVERRQSFLLRLGDCLKSLADPIEMQMEASRILGEQLTATRVHCAELEEGGRQLVVRAVWCAPGADGSLDRAGASYASADLGPTLVRTVRTGRTLVLEDSTSDPRLESGEREAYARLGARAAIFVPTLDGAAPAGELAVFETEPRHWTAAEVQLAEETAARTTEAVERVRTQRKLDEMRESLEIAVDAAGMGAWDADLVSRTLRTSRRYDEIFGYERDRPAWEPKLIREHMFPEDREILDRALTRALASGEFRLEARVRRRDGTVRWIQSRGRVYYGHEGRAMRIAGVTLDVTAHKRAEAAREEARRAEQEAKGVKSRFLATMSHELRTPLTGVMGWADLLQDGLMGPVTERQKQALARIKTASSYLVTMIEEILTVSRVESGAESVRTERCDLASIACEAVGALKKDAHQKELGLEIRGAERPFPVRTDPDKVLRVLTALIDNAVKHTLEGGVIVELDRTDPAWAEVHVHDTGPGIAPEDQEHVFEAFTQVDASYTRQVGGTGLGLAIARSLAGLLGGDVSLCSRLDEGSTFTLRLPVH